PSVVSVRSHRSARNASYAAKKSVWARAAAAFAALIVPVTGQLVCVIAEPGDTPTFPATVALVHVTAVPARIAKVPDVPSGGADDEAGGGVLFAEALSAASDGEEVADQQAKADRTERQSLVLHNIWVPQSQGGVRLNYRGTVTVVTDGEAAPV